MSIIETVTGKFVDISDPQPEQISLEDIAWSLSRMPRYCGHTVFATAYSVAQHSLFVSREAVKLLGDEADPLLKLRVGLHALMHDATECYTSDVPGPVKHLPGIHEVFEALETKLENVIFIALGVSPMDYKLIKQADKRCQAIEMFFFMSSRGKNIPSLGEIGLLELQAFEQPLPAPIVYQQFKQEYYRLQHLISENLNGK